MHTPSTITIYAHNRKQFPYRVFSYTSNVCKCLLIVILLLCWSCLACASCWLKNGLVLFMEFKQTYYMMCICTLPPSQSTLGPEHHFRADLIGFFYLSRHAASVLEVCWYHCSNVIVWEMPFKSHGIYIYIGSLFLALNTIRQRM